MLTADYLMTVLIFLLIRSYRSIDLVDLDPSTNCIDPPIDDVDRGWSSRSVAPRLARTKAIRVPGIIIPVVADEQLFPSRHRPRGHVASIGVLKCEVGLSERGVFVTIEVRMNSMWGVGTRTQAKARTKARC